MQNINGYINGGLMAGYAGFGGSFSARTSTTDYSGDNMQNYSNGGANFNSYRSVRTGYNSSGQLVGSNTTHGKQIGINYIIRVQ